MFFLNTQPHSFLHITVLKHERPARLDNGEWVKPVPAPAPVPVPVKNYYGDANGFGYATYQ